MRRDVEESRRIIGLPMAEKSAAGDESAHHWIQDSGMLMRAKDSLDGAIGGAGNLQNGLGGTLAEDQGPVRINGELRILGLDREIVPHETEHCGVDRIFGLVVLENAVSEVPGGFVIRGPIGIAGEEIFLVETAEQLET